MIVKNMRNTFRNLVSIVVIAFCGCSGNVIQHRLETSSIRQYDKAEFSIEIEGAIENPYDQHEVKLDMVLSSPSGKKIVVPCYYDPVTPGGGWKGRFAPREAGAYHYEFLLTKSGKQSSASEKAQFQSIPSGEDGFLHPNDYWTFKFDSGKPFRGIGENVGWESRSFENKKWTYDYLLPTLSENGANFFRTWMCVWNLPLAFPNVNDTDRYQDSNGYFHEEGMRRMDELVELSDSLGLYMMLAFDAHGSLMEDGYWKFNSHNVKNGGTANTPEEFFTNEASKLKYKNRLRYIVARWGYSTSIAAWEFFNEIDNAAFTATPHDSVLISHDIITNWHDEMSTYLKEIDPYDHIITTSVSHREIEGMNDLPNIDLNQKHIYNKTHLIAPMIEKFIALHDKPYVIGEFGYDWNWDNVTHDRGAGFDYDYKRGLWYGMFSPTPILPMTWWWEFFDERDMTRYFKSVREISDRMIDAGKGQFEKLSIESQNLEAYGAKCGETYFVYLLNGSAKAVTGDVNVSGFTEGAFQIRYYSPSEGTYSNEQNHESFKGKLSNVLLRSQEEMVVIISPMEEGQVKKSSTSPQ